MFGAWGEPDHDTSIGIIHRALDAGINFIDTADVYSQGESEVIVGKALADGRRDDVTSTLVASGAWMVRVHPLSPGKHTLVIRADAAGAESATITYELTAVTRRRS